MAEPGPAWSSVSPEAFERQLSALERRGYRGAGGASLPNLASGRGDGKHRAALLTFDDGYRDNHDVAFPLLRRYGFTGLFFVLPTFVDRGAPLLWPEVEERVRAHPSVMRSMTWRQVEAMAEGGCEFGSHGLLHRHLTRLDDEELHEELWESRRLIKERLGNCDTLAYPFGDWSPRVARAAAAAGYSWAFTLPDGAQRDATALSIPRIPVDHRDGSTRFALKASPLGRRLLLSPLKDRLRGLRLAQGR
ncbi:MAG: polysaccharide deacetylase family protein [Thermoleophilaceae bacterium]